MSATGVTRQFDASSPASGSAIQEQRDPILASRGSVNRLGNGAESIGPTAAIQSRGFAGTKMLDAKNEAGDRQENWESRFRELLENVQLIAMMLNVEGRITFCNSYLFQLTG